MIKVGDRVGIARAFNPDYDWTISKEAIVFWSSGMLIQIMLKCPEGGLFRYTAIIEDVVLLARA